MRIFFTRITLVNDEACFESVDEALFTNDDALVRINKVLESAHQIRCHLSSPVKCNALCLEVICYPSGTQTLEFLYEVDDSECHIYCRDLHCLPPGMALNPASIIENLEVLISLNTDRFRQDGLMMCTCTAGSVNGVDEELSKVRAILKSTLGTGMVVVFDTNGKMINRVYCRTLCDDEDGGAYLSQLNCAETAFNADDSCRRRCEQNQDSDDESADSGRPERKRRRQADGAAAIAAAGRSVWAANQVPGRTDPEATTDALRLGSA